jgi:hypothetical protein
MSLQTERNTKRDSAEMLVSERHASNSNVSLRESKVLGFGSLNVWVNSFSALSCCRTMNSSCKYSTRAAICGDANEKSVEPELVVFMHPPSSAASH